MRSARYFLATGAIGELFPILAIAIFLSVNSRFSALISLAAIALVAAVLAVFPRFVHGGRLARIAHEGADATSQTTLRLTILLLMGLLVLAGEFGLDVVLGAFLAGAVLRRWAPGDVHALEAKLDAIGYGFFIPVFFVTAGMGIDLQSIRESPDRLVVFFILLLVVRGLPMLVVYRRRSSCTRAGPADAARRHHAPARGRADPDRPVHGDDAARERGCAGRRGRAVGALLPPDRHRDPPSGAHLGGGGAAPTGPYTRGSPLIRDAVARVHDRRDQSVSSIGSATASTSAPLRRTVTSIRCPIASAKRRFCKD